MLARMQEHTCNGVHGSVDYHDDATGAHVGAFGCVEGILLVYGNGSSVMLPTATRVGCESVMHVQWRPQLTMPVAEQTVHLQACVYLLENV